MAKYKEQCKVYRRFSILNFMAHTNDRQQVGEILLLFLSGGLIMDTEERDCG